MVKETKKFILKIWHNTKLQKKKKKETEIKNYLIFTKFSKKVQKRIRKYKITKPQNYKIT